MRFVSKAFHFLRYDIPSGVSNLIRWFPIIWRDCDWDWDFLAQMMERKLTWMAEHFEKHGYHTDSALRAREMRQCAWLLRRMMSGHHVTDKGLRIGCSHREWARRVMRNENNDARHLGLILGKHMRCWWN